VNTSFVVVFAVSKHR